MSARGGAMVHGNALTSNKGTPADKNILSLKLETH